MFRSTVAALPLLALSTWPAMAHHPMGGAVPTTVWHGFLSGLGHPILGPDHLIFVLALGATAAFAAPGLLIVATFISTTMLGVLTQAAGINIPLAEALIGVTLMALGGVFLTGRTFAAPLWVTFAALAGVVHGYAFGEAIVGADRGVVGAYLIGLALVQFTIAAAMAAFTRAFMVADGFGAHRMKAAGGALMAMGLLFAATAWIPD
jgi:urease accessory protein